MDLLSSLFSGLYGDKTNPIAALLPLLLNGGKHSDISGILKLLNNSNVSDGLGPLINNLRSESPSYPPLFEKRQPNSDLFTSIIQSGANGFGIHRKEENDKSTYPYELQYNRPEKQEKK